MIQELDRVILTNDLPEYSLEEGDISTVVLGQQGSQGYEDDANINQTKGLRILTLLSIS